MSLVNLLPDDYIERRRQHRANVMCLCLFAVVLIGVIGAWLVSEQSRRRTLEVRDRVDASYADAVRLIDQMKELQSQRAKMLAKAEVASSLVERVPRSYLLAQIANALPTGACLVEFSLVPKEVRVAATPAEPRASAKFSRAAKGADPGERRLVGLIEIVGRAATDVQVAQFMANLLRQPLLDSVELGYSEEKIIDRTPLREFKITMILKPNVDVIELTPQARRVAPAEDEADGQAGARS